jgi:dTDP-L-rhamnose 4-epimerase
MKVLITGGAGFIGSRLAVSLARQSAEVTVLDNLSPQVHGPDAKFGGELSAAANCIEGDICDDALLRDVLADQEVVIHLAAETGTGQSMYAVKHYGQVNIQGTATLLDSIVNHRPKFLSKLIVASSRAVYGEGAYVCAVHGRIRPEARTAENMEAGRFEPLCPICDANLSPIATSEDTPFAPSSFYGLTKQVQEQIVLLFGRTLGLDAFALRFQNVYGPGQSLSNPYTGILAIFSNLVRQGKALNIFEDGLESRDFVYIDDVVAATIACASPDVHGVVAANVGSGVRTSVLDVAQEIIRHFHAETPVRVSGDFRLGDIRHNFADLSLMSRLTGFAPKWSFSDGLQQFLSWAEAYEPSDAGFDRSLVELKALGMLKSR